MNILENSMIEEFSKHFSNQINKILFSVHVILFTFFFLFHIYIMAWINVFSISIYLVSFLVIKKNKAHYLRIAYIEVVLHMAAAVICLGWDYGFQLYCFALIPMIFYAEYLCKKSDETKCYPKVVSIIIICLFILLKLMISIMHPLYIIKGVFVQNLIFVINAAMIGGFDIYFMSLYNHISSKSEDMILEYAQKDALTGLKNKAWLLQMEQSFLKDMLDAKTEVMMAIIDIDDFKKLNDTYGHQFGDKVLFHIAAQLKNMEKNGYYVCRWGGEEFLVFGSGENIFEKGTICLERLIQKISDTEFLYQRTKIKVTVTVGAVKRKQEMSFEMLMKQADEKLYIGKRSGKNKVQY